MSIRFNPCQPCCGCNVDITGIIYDPNGNLLCQSNGQWSEPNWQGYVTFSIPDSSHTTSTLVTTVTPGGVNGTAFASCSKFNIKYTDNLLVGPNYSISITLNSPNYETVSKTVDAVCGQHQDVDFHLVAVKIPGCFCSVIPDTLQMNSLHPTCNGGMFQSCILQWGPTPPEYSALSLGANCYLSTASFTDGNGDSFRYYFTCNLGQFTLSRVYAISIFGSPFRDSVRYSWPIAASGNSCSPFLMSNGQIYLGGDFSCDIVISE